METPQTQILLSHLEKLRRDDPQNGWAMSYNLIRTHTPFGFLGSAGFRRAQEYCEQGICERIKDGKYTKVRWLFPDERIGVVPKEKGYVILNERGSVISSAFFGENGKQIKVEPQKAMF